MSAIITEDPERRIRAGKHARVLLEDQGFKALMSELKAESLVAFVDSTSGDAEKREEIYRDMQAIGRIEARLKALADGAAVDERKIKAAEKAEAGKK